MSCFHGGGGVSVAVVDEVIAGGMLGVIARKVLGRLEDGTRWNCWVLLWILLGQSLSPDRAQVVVVVAMVAAWPIGARAQPKGKLSKSSRDQVCSSSFFIRVLVFGTLRFEHKERVCSPVFFFTFLVFGTLRCEHKRRGYVHKWIMLVMVMLLAVIVRYGTRYGTRLLAGCMEDRWGCTEKV